MRIADNRKVYFFDEGGEHISSDGTDFTFASGGDINLTATTNVNIPSGVGITFGDDAEKISGDGTDLTIAGNNINLTASADIVVPANIGITFGTGEKIEGDNTDLTITSGAKINLTSGSTVDVTGNLEASGTYTGGGLMTTGGNIVIPDAGNIGSASDTNAIAISSAGVVTLSAATEASAIDTAALVVSGGLGVAKDVWIGDDLTLDSDSAVISLGADQDVTLTHVADTGILLNSTRQLQFGDSGTYIHQSADGVLDLVSDTEIEINATTIDINGAVALDGAITGATDITLSGELDAATGDFSGAVDIAGDLTLSAGGDGALRFSAASSVKILDNSATSLVFEEDDNAYMTFVTTNSSEAIKFDKALDINADMDIDAAIQLDGALTVGVDGTGQDVKFFGDTAGQYMLWDQSADELVLAGDSKLSFNDAAGDENIIASADGHLEINSGTTLDMTAPTVDINASTAVTIDTDTVTVSSGNANDPLFVIKNTANDTDGAILRFVKDKGAAGADNDVAGLIEFYADDDNQDNILFAKIAAQVSDASNGAEGGKLSLGVATHDGEFQNGLIIADGSTEDEVDVTIGNGSASVTTVAGDLSVTANTTITGNLTVNGTTTTASTDNTVIKDTLIELGNGVSGTPGNDSGIVIERGSADNAFIGFDESADKFIVGTGSFTGASTGDLTITTGTLVANVEGNLTGTLQTAAQTNITSVGTLSSLTTNALTVDDVGIDGKVITMTGSTSDTATITAGTNGTLTIVTTDDAGANANIQITADGTAELAGTTVTLDSEGGITLDANGGTITFADNGSSLGTITSSGYSGTAAVATTVTITDNESTNEDNAVIFAAGGDVDGGNLGLESDGNLTYNPSTGRLTATQLAGTLQTAAQTNITSVGTLGALTVDDVAIDGKVITMTGDTSDTVTITAGTNGTLAITTTDAAAAAANITITADGTFEAVGTAITLDSGAGINLETDALSIGNNGDTDVAVTFNGNDNDGVITWMEDDDEFKFSDDILMDSTKKIQFGDTASFIHQSADGTLTIDGEAIIDLNASTRVDVSVDLKVGGEVQTAKIAYTDGDDAITIADGGGITANTSLTLASGSTVTAIKDEDNMSSDSDTSLATQQSIKAYVDSVSANANNVSGLNATGAELNTVADFSAVSVDTSTAITNSDAILMFDNGNEIGYRDVDLLVTYMESTIDSLSSLTTTGDLNAGSITSGFNSIDIGSSNLTATGTVSLGATSFNDNNVTNVGSIALDTITNDGTDITLDSSGDIILDAAGNNVTIKSGGTSILDVANNSSDVELTVSVADKNFKIKGTDSSSAITALDIDMAAAGAATFNDKIIATELDISGDVDIDGTLEADAITINGTAIGSIYGVVAGSSSIVTVGDVNAGTITSGFGNIDIGSSNLTATGTISLGATSFNDNNLTNVGNIALDSITADGSAITITGDTTFADGAYDFDIASHDGSNGLKLGGTLVTSTAGELNLLDGGTSVGGSITIADSDGFVVNDGGTMKTIPASDIKTYAGGSAATKGFAIAAAIVFG